MFLGALLPGLVLVGLYMLYVFVYARINPKAAPPVTFKGSFDFKFWIKVIGVIIPPLALIFAVLGSILMGIATVNQAGSIGAIGATMMAGYRLHKGRKDAYYPIIISVVSVIPIFFLAKNYNLNIKARGGIITPITFIQNLKSKFPLNDTGGAAFGFILA